MEKSEPPLVVHLARISGLLTLCGGFILLVVQPLVGVAIVLLSALYFVLAEIINYLARIATLLAADRRKHSLHREDEADLAA